MAARKSRLQWEIIAGGKIRAAQREIARAASPDAVADARNELATWTLALANIQRGFQQPPTRDTEGRS